MPNETPEQHLQRVAAARQGLRDHAVEMGRVRELEQHTPAAEDRGYNINATHGYQQWMQTYQALEADQLSPLANERLDRMSSILTNIREEYSKLGEAHTPEMQQAFVNRRIEELRTTGETYMRAGHDKHFNVVRLAALPDGGYSYTVYDAGHESQNIRRNELGHLRVDAVIERRLMPGADPEKILHGNVTKMFATAGTGTYELARDYIESQLESTPMRMVEDTAQIRNNCSTMGQRILLQDVTGDARLTGQFYAFMTDQQHSPQSLDALLDSKSRAIAVGQPEIVRAMNLNESGWQPYKSAAGGQAYRYEQPFGNAGEHTPEMQSFQENLEKNGVRVVWAEKGGKNYAYVLQSSDPASYNRLGTMMASTSRDLASEARADALFYGSPEENARSKMDGFLQEGLGRQNVLSVERGQGVTRVTVPADFSRSELTRIGVDISGVERAGVSAVAHVITIPDDRLPQAMRQQMARIEIGGQQWGDLQRQSQAPAPPVAPDNTPQRMPFNTPAEAMFAQPQPQQQSCIELPANEIAARQAQREQQPHRRAEVSEREATAEAHQRAENAKPAVETRNPIGSASEISKVEPTSTTATTRPAMTTDRSSGRSQAAEFASIYIQAASTLGVPVETASAALQTLVQASDSPDRVYHNTAHFADVARGGIEAKDRLVEMGVAPELANRMAATALVAGATHDVFDTVADQRFSPEIERTVGPFVTRTEDGKFVISANAASSENARIAMATFGVQPGATLNPFNGQNEFINTVHFLEAHPNLPVADKIAGAVVIQQTIPFDAATSINDTLARVDALGAKEPNLAITANERRAMGMTSALVANTDVANFTYGQEEFRDNTIKLFEEARTDFRSNEGLATKALNQAGFFTGLANDIESGQKTVFRDFEGVVPAEQLARMNADAVKNIRSSVADMHAIAVAASPEIAASRGVNVEETDVARGRELIAEARGQVETRATERAARTPRLNTGTDAQRAQQAQPPRETTAPTISGEQISAERQAARDEAAADKAFGRTTKIIPMVPPAPAGAVSTPSEPIAAPPLVKFTPEQWQQYAREEIDFEGKPFPEPKPALPAASVSRGEPALSSPRSSDMPAGTSPMPTVNPNGAPASPAVHSQEAHTLEHVGKTAPTRINGRALEGRAGVAVTRATMAVDAAATVQALARGDTEAAQQHGKALAINTAMEIGQSQAVWNGAGHAVERLAGDAAEHAMSRVAITGIKAVGGKIPLVGGVVGLGFGLYDVGSETWELAHGRSNWKKLASTTASSVVGIVGGIVGFGAGEAGQEVTHYATKAAFGEADAAHHSATVELAQAAVVLANSTGGQPDWRAQQAQRARQEQAARANAAPVHSSFSGRAGAQHLNQEMQNLEGQMSSTNWGKFIGNGDAAVTRSEMRETMGKYGISIAEIDKDRNGDITGKEFTDALKAHRVNAHTVEKTSAPAAPAANQDWRAQQAQRVRQEQAALANASPVHSSFSGRAGAQHLNAELNELEGQINKSNWGQFIGNGDAKVTVNEIRATMQKYQISIAELDKNGDGNISGRELSTALSAHHVNAHPVNKPSGQGR